MLDIKNIIANPDFYKKGIAIKNWNIENVDIVIKAYEDRNNLLKQVEDLRAEQNRMAKQLPQLDWNLNQKQEMIHKMSEIKKTLKKLTPKSEELSIILKKTLSIMPNPAHESVNPWLDEEWNKVIRKFSEKPSFTFEPKPHWELWESLDLIDSEKWAKISWSRFHFLKNELVQIQFALIQYAFEIITKKWFSPMLPPLMVKAEAAYGTGYLESWHEEEIYAVNPWRDDLYLIGTSEVPNTAYYMDEIIPEDKLPIKIVAYSSCFRREAWSGGKDEKGILRCHQFDKIEMWVFAHPDKSYEELEKIREIEEEIWQGLWLH